MKNLIQILIAFFALLSCSFNQENKIDERYSNARIEDLMMSAVSKIDTNATVNVTQIEKNDSIIINVRNIITVNETLEFAELLKDYLLAKIFIQNQQEIPSKIFFKIHFKRGFDYSFNGRLFPQVQDKLKDNEFTQYIEYLLVNITYMDAAYFDLKTSVTKEYYQKYDYQGTLLSLLLDFYFANNDNRFETWMALFYLYSDFPYNDDVKFNKSILDSSFNYIGFNTDKWTTEYVKKLYMNTYIVDTIYTPENEVFYYRGMKN